MRGLGATPATPQAIIWSRASYGSRWRYGWAFWYIPKFNTACLLSTPPRIPKTTPSGAVMLERGSFHPRRPVSRSQIHLGRASHFIALAGETGSPEGIEPSSLWHTRKVPRVTLALRMSLEKSRLCQFLSPAALPLKLRRFTCRSPARLSAEMPALSREWASGP